MELQIASEERAGFVMRFAQGIERAREDAAMTAARQNAPSNVSTYEPEP